MNRKIIDKIFKYALNEGASGLSLEAQTKSLTLCYDFKGQENRTFTLPINFEAEIGQNLRKILALPPDELVKKKYCKIFKKDYSLSFQLTISPARLGNRIVIKIIPKNNKLLRLNQLGLNRNQLKTVRELLQKKSGLILVSAPNNQGKRTTLNALINEIDKPNISSYALGYKLEHEFANLSSLAANSSNWNKILNLDSEIIITDLNSPLNWQNAIRAAETGRLVMGILPADSAWEVLAAYLKLKMPLEAKVKALSLIINQRVLPLSRSNSLRTPSKLKKSSSPRTEIALFEFLEINKTIKNFLTTRARKKDKNNFWEDLAKLALNNNYHSLQADYQEKKKAGLIS